MGKRTTGPLSALGRFLPSKIRWKIAAPYLVLTVVVAVAGTFLATRVVVDSLGGRFDAQLEAAAGVAADGVVRREEEHLKTVRSIMYTIGVSEAVAAEDRERLRGLVEPILANDGREYGHVFDLGGNSLLDLRLTGGEKAAYEEAGPAAGLASAQAVQSVLAGGDELGDKAVEIVEGAEDTVLYTAGPIRDGDRIVGVVVVGSSLDGFLESIKASAGSDVTFYGLDGEVLGTTLMGGADDLTGAFEDVRREPSTADLAGARQSTGLAGRNVDLLYGGLRVRDETIGFFSVGMQADFISSASSDTRLMMLAVFGAATVAVLAIGMAIAHGVTQPLLSLVRSARVVAGGDLTVRAAVKSRDEVGALAASFNVMTERLASQHLQTIRALTSAIDARDPYTAGHSVRVGQLSVEIGWELELPRRELQYLEIGGYLHDIGKIGIRDHILLKEAPLTEAERKLIEEHPRIGLKIIRHVDLADEVLEVVGGHHEKLDGTGYPLGRSQEDISIYARIAAVSDIYDAITTERPYKPALTVEHAVEMLLKEVGEGRIDEQVVQGLIRVLPRWQRRLRVEKSLRGFSIFDLDEANEFRIA